MSPTRGTGPDSALQALAAEVHNLHAKVEGIEMGFQTMRVTEAENRVRYDGLKEDLQSIKRVLNWVATLVVGGFITAIMTFVFKGGLGG